MEKERMVEVSYLQAQGILDGIFHHEIAAVWRSRTNANNELQDRILQQWQAGEVALRVPLEKRDEIRHRILGI